MAGAVTEGPVSQCIAWAGGQRSGVSSHQTLRIAGLPGVRKLIDLVLRVEEIQGELGREGHYRSSVSILLPVACALPGPLASSSSQSPSSLGTSQVLSSTETYSLSIPLVP